MVPLVPRHVASGEGEGDRRELTRVDKVIGGGSAERKTYDAGKS